MRPRVSGAIESVHFRGRAVVRAGPAAVRHRSAALRRGARARARRRSRARAPQLANADAELKRAQAARRRSSSSARRTPKLRAAAQLQRGRGPRGGRGGGADRGPEPLVHARARRRSRAALRTGGSAPGNIVAADTTVLTTIVTEDPIRFLFDAPESALLKYKREAGGATRAAASRSACRTRPSIAGRAASTSSTTRSTAAPARSALRAVVDESRRLHLRRACSARCGCSRLQPFDALLVPDQAIVTDQTRQVVYVVDAEGIVGQKVVQPGRLIDGLRVITRRAHAAGPRRSSAACSERGPAAGSR